MRLDFIIFLCWYLTKNASGLSRTFGTGNRWRSIRAISKCIQFSCPWWKIPSINILTSTKNATLIITDFLAVIKENEQRRTASLCGGWAMLENDFNLICRWRVIPMTSYRLNVHMTALCIDRLCFQFEFAPSLCRKCFANQRTNLDHFFKQLCFRVITLWNYDVILKTKCKVRLQNLPTFLFSFK